MKLSIKVDSTLNTQMLELRTFPCFPDQNLSQIGQGFQELWSDIQTDKHRLTKMDIQKILKRNRDQSNSNWILKPIV